MKKVLLTSVPLYGVIIGEYEGEKLPSGGEPYKLSECMLVILSPDGKVVMANVKEVFSFKSSTIEVNTPYIVVEDKTPIMSAYISAAKNIIIPVDNKITTK